MSRPARLARGTAAAAVSVLFAALGHTAGHASGPGGAPGSLAMVLGLLIAVPVCVFLVGRRRSAARVAGAVILSQAAFHTLFALVGTADIFAGGANAAHAHGGHSVMVGQTGPGLAAVSDAGAAMWFAHAVAALATIAALRRGERAAHSLLGLVIRFVSRIGRLVLAPQPLGPIARPFAVSSLAVAVRRPYSAPLLRGPPVGVSAT